MTDTLQTADAHGWRPIETAPKDGGEVLGIYYCDWGDGSMPSIYGPWTISFSRRSKSWQSSWNGMRVIESQSDFGTDYHEPDVQPTHWQPLPSPPEQQT
jgi:hypothetical protein